MVKKDATTTKKKEAREKTPTKAKGASMKKEEEGGEKKKADEDDEEDKKEKKVKKKASSSSFHPYSSSGDLIIVPVGLKRRFEITHATKTAAGGGANKSLYMYWEIEKVRTVDCCCCTVGYRYVTSTYVLPVVC